MTYVLHSAPSTAGLAVHWLLIELGAPFELRMLDFAAREQKRPPFLALNPDGRVPVLEVDGRPHAEVAALLVLLAERHPERGLSPPPGAPERADFLQWMFYFANTMQPAFRAWYYPDEPAGPGAEPAVQDAARRTLDLAWTRLDARFADGRPHLLGEAASVADLLMVMLARWSRNLPNPATDHAHLRAYLRRMRAWPSLKTVHAREGLTDWIDDA